MRVRFTGVTFPKEGGRAYARGEVVDLPDDRAKRFVDAGRAQPAPDEPVTPQTGATAPASPPASTPEAKPAR